VPRGRSKEPRRRKRPDEVWHKNKGPHKKHSYVLCLKCKRAFSVVGWKKHVRLCFGFRRCHICELPFPCTTTCCPWRFPELPIIPSNLVPYFRDRHKPMTPEREALELPALKWFAKIRRKPWSER
jgi:hypothetical protein